MEKTNTDAELLRRYAEVKSEAAIAELVRRHLDLVYSAALRRLGGDYHRAADVAQQVFTTLARDAQKLSGHGVLTAWLYAATRHAAIDLIRAEQRRATREQEATAMQNLFAAAPDADWAKLRPVLDGVMDELSNADRTAVLLRFFEKRPFADIGTALNLSEDAARMRVERALDKLHALLAKRGITSTAGALGAVLTHQAVAAAPSGLAAGIVGAVLSETVGAGASAGVLAFMSSTKITLTLAVAAALAIGGALFQSNRASTTANELAAARGERAGLAATLAEVETKIHREEQALQARTAALEQEPSAAARTADAAAAADAEKARQANALQQLLRNDPQLQQMWRDSARQRWLSSWSPFFQRLRLTPAEIEQTLAELQRRADLKIGSTTSGVGFPDALAADARFMESQRHPAESFLVENIVLYAAPEGVAFTPEQTEQLFKTFVELRPPSLAPHDPRMPALQANLDWAQVITQASAYLEPAQLSKLENRAARMSRDKILKAATPAAP